MYIYNIINKDIMYTKDIIDTKYIIYNTHKPKTLNPPQKKKTKDTDTALITRTKTKTRTREIIASSWKIWMLPKKILY